MFDLEEVKEEQLKQINQLNKSIRHFEGEIAEKEYLMANMTQQM